MTFAVLRVAAGDVGFKMDCYQQGRVGHEKRKACCQLRFSVDFKIVTGVVGGSLSVDR